MVNGVLRGGVGMIRTTILTMLSAALLSSAGAIGARAADLPMSPVEQQAVEASSTVTITIEALALKRWSDDVLLSYIADSDWELSTDDLAEDYALGAAGSLSLSLGGGWGVALSGLYASGSGSGELISGGQQLGATYSDDYSPGNLEFENSEVAFSMNADQQWTLAGVNVAATFDLGQHVKLSVGPAWLHYANSLHSNVLDEENTSNYIDDVTITSTNDLYGGVVGLEATLPVTDTISIGGRIAGGVYLAHKALDRTYESQGGFDSPFDSDLEQASSSVDEVATSVEFSPKVALAVSPNLSLSLGGTFLWLNGVDEASSHFQSIGTDDSSGDLADEDPASTAVQFGGLTLGLTGTF